MTPTPPKYQPGKVIKGWDNLHWALANQRAIYIRQRCYSTAFAKNLCYCSLDGSLRTKEIRWAILRKGEKA